MKKEQSVFDSIIPRGVTDVEIAKALGIDRKTLRCRFRCPDTFRVCELKLLYQFLGTSADEMDRVNREVMMWTQ